MTCAVGRGRSCGKGREWRRRDNSHECPRALVRGLKGGGGREKNFVV